MSRHAKGQDLSFKTNSPAQIHWRGTGRLTPDQRTSSASFRALTSGRTASQYGKGGDTQREPGDGSQVAGEHVG